MEAYLQNIPKEAGDCGISKVLLVRREIIHIKHIFTEIFHRKTVDIETSLTECGMDLMSYMTYMTQRLRRLHKISREFTPDPNEVVQFEGREFFRQIEFLDVFKTQLILDFDGVITNHYFRTSGLYELCRSRIPTVVCSANPTITKGRFEKYDITYPEHVYANKGKLKKLRKLILLSGRNDFTFYVDDEEKYLKIAWLFGIKTYQYNNKQIKHFSLNSK